MFDIHHLEGSDTIFAGAAAAVVIQFHNFFAKRAKRLFPHIAAVDVKEIHLPALAAAR